MIQQPQNQMGGGPFSNLPPVDLAGLLGALFGGGQQQGPSQAQQAMQSLQGPQMQGPGLPNMQPASLGTPPQGPPPIQAQLNLNPLQQPGVVQPSPQQVPSQVGGAPGFSNGSGDWVTNPGGGYKPNMPAPDLNERPTLMKNPESVPPGAQPVGDALPQIGEPGGPPIPPKYEAYPPEPNTKDPHQTLKTILGLISPEAGRMLQQRDEDAKEVSRSAHQDAMKEIDRRNSHAQKIYEDDLKNYHDTQKEKQAQAKQDKEDQVRAWLAGAREVPSGTPGSQVIGGKAYSLAQEKGMVAVPEGSDIAKAFVADHGKPAVDGVVYIPQPLLQFYGENASQREKTESMKKLEASLEVQALKSHKQVSDYFRENQENPANPKDHFQEEGWHDLFDTAAESDKKSGSSSEMKQAKSKWLDFLEKNSPAAKSDAAKASLEQKEQFAAFAHSLTSGGKPDPQEVKEGADAVLMNSDNMDVITKLSGGDKEFERAVRREVLNRGLDLTKLSAQAKESRDYANIADKEFQPLEQKIDFMDKMGSLGPYASRMAAFMQGKVGKGDKDFSQLSGEIDLMRKLVAKIHLGVRGAGSPQNAEAMKQKLDEGKMDGKTLKAGLEAYRTFINYYKRAGLRTREEAQGSSATPSGNSTIDQLVDKYKNK